MELKNRSFQYGKVALAVRTQYHQSWAEFGFQVWGARSSAEGAYRGAEGAEGGRVRRGGVPLPAGGVKNF